MAFKSIISFLVLSIGLSSLSFAQKQTPASGVLAPTIENLGRYLQGRAEFVGNEKEFAQFVLTATANSEALHDSEGRLLWSRIETFINSQRKDAIYEYALVSGAKNVIDVFEGYRLLSPNALVVEGYVDEVPHDKKNSPFKSWLYRASNQAFRSICSRVLDPNDFRAMYDYENRLRVKNPSK